MGAERLEVLSGGMAGKHIALEAEIVLGRDEEGPGCLGGDTQLSRRHTRIERTAHGHFLIEDLGSTNGTRVNGKLITGPRVLRDGDEIEVGKTRLKLIADPGIFNVANMAVTFGAVMLLADSWRQRRRRTEGCGTEGIR